MAVHEIKHVAFIEVKLSKLGALWVRRRVKSEEIIPLLKLVMNNIKLGRVNYN